MGSSDAGACPGLGSVCAGVELGGSVSEVQGVGFVGPVVVAVVDVEFAVLGDVVEGEEVDSAVYGLERDVGFVGAEWVVDVGGKAGRGSGDGVDGVDGNSLGEVCVSIV